MSVIFEQNKHNFHNHKVKSRLRRTAQTEYVNFSTTANRATQLVCEYVLCNHQKYSIFVIRPNPTKLARRPNPWSTLLYFMVI